MVKLCTDTPLTWSAECQAYDFFSTFLERGLISSKSLDLTFTPLEYMEQLFSCTYTEDGKGYLYLIMMLFVEYFQAEYTGVRKIELPQEKYETMSTQFLFFVELELLRREGKIFVLREENLFNPNLKTVITLSTKDMVDELRERTRLIGVTLKFL